MTTLALVGNPNSGKSTLFNALTGAHQRVSNWSGTTVEQKTGSYQFDNDRFDVVDLPGLYSLDGEEIALGEDERIVREYLQGNEAQVLVNVIDATSLRRGLFLTSQLLEKNIPVVVALNMVDVAENQRLDIDTEKLSKELGCPIIPISASRRRGIAELKEALAKEHEQEPLRESDTESKFTFIDATVDASVTKSGQSRNLTELIDKVVLNRWLSIPILLFVIYMLFFLTINVGSAFIDLFDILGATLFIEGPRALFEWMSFPAWLTAFLADGVGGGVQLVCTFIPVMACMFLLLSLLEDSGYMGRAAFVLDKPLQKLGLPGRALMPLIVGFGCNVPSVMATRSLDNRPDRILTTIMAPYMSCGARLTVYALFAAAFFPSNGQNIVFCLYLVGILVAIISAAIVRRHLIGQTSSSFIQELPSYHLPTLRGVLTHTWHRLKGFIVRAGKAIVMVVIVLNVVSSVGTDGSFGNENKENSVLSAIGQTITPFFHPMGIREDNWPATVGIFTGFFAKEVVVGTLDALYTPQGDDGGELEFWSDLQSAFATVPSNLKDVGSTLTDPLGFGVADIEDVETAVSEQEVEINTVTAMQSLFDGKLGAFSYLLFILLYMPCVATIGVIYKELGTFWAVFSTAWSVVVAYSLAVIFYQAGNFLVDPAESSMWLAIVITVTGLMFVGLIVWGRHRAPAQDRLISVVQAE